MITIGVAGALIFGGCGTPLSTLVLGKTGQAVVSATPAIGSTGADPDTPIVVQAANGTLTHVSVRGPKGEIAGTMDESGTTWTSSNKTLTFDSEYLIEASAVDPDGLMTTVNNGFRTLKPSNTFQAEVSGISKGSKVGVGMPLRVTFTTPIQDRANVERKLKVYASKPLAGAWSWSEDRTQVTFRPEKFWPANTKIALRAPLYGVASSKKIFGSKNLSFDFSTGSSLVLTVDASTLQLTVVRDGKKIRTIPVTTGKSGFATRSGTVAIMGKEGTIRMTDPSLNGTSEAYDLDVSYSMRIRPSGEFIHAAPWSVGSQGYSRVSHGCIGMSTGNASWLYSMVEVGDPVIVKNTGREQELDNGITDFSVPWRKWLKNSATGVQQVGPGGGIAPAPAKAPAKAKTKGSAG
ncbi:MAG: Ig-like domain-containing protein [Candidatus Nanopelagicales bacterium]|nr:Ig-like domain-containing protein [Candidatus Nanopelagicales bacterium]